MARWYFRSINIWRFYSRNKVTTFKNSISGREDLKGINKNSIARKKNKELLEKISKRVFELVNPFSKNVVKNFWNFYDGKNFFINVVQLILRLKTVKESLKQL
ncbi:hypothetical protein EfmJHP10_33710 (plasmid) [Enterococcus faecium]|nr:hypothetical protein EfmJHP10_33710 [Enterococcus faecium]